MAPGTESIASTQSTVMTVPSVSSGEAKSLKNFEIDEDFAKDITTAFGEGNAKDWDFHLISAPVGFPSLHLQDIPLNSSEVFPVVVHSEEDDHKTDYICENTSSNMITPKIFPFPYKKRFLCVNVKSTFSIRKSIQEGKVGEKYFIPRPHPKPMSEGLRERMKPFGWQNPGETIDILSSPSKKFKLQSLTKKEKKKRKKRQLEDSLPSLLDKNSVSEVDSSETVLGSPPKKKKKHETLTESPVPKYLELLNNGKLTEPFVALNTSEQSSSKLQKKHKKDKKARKLEKSLATQENQKKSKKKKKEKKHKKEKKKLKKKKHTESSLN